ncbi:MAG TPA: hypothetical protein VFF30_07945 [Nitrososphaerales archaeon]|nr:hypothetical protein [Nitrososphaerales archaeon]
MPENRKELIGKFVRIEFTDHFRFEKVSKRKLLVNLNKYAQNSAVGDVLDITDDFIVLRNSWSDAHESIAGIAIFIPSIIRVTVLRESPYRSSNPRKTKETNGHMR